MASQAIEVPTDGVPVQRCAQADRSFGRRAFLATLFGVCTAVLFTFFAVQLAMRAQVKAGVIRSLLDTQRSMEQILAARTQRGHLALASIAANPMLGATILRAGHANTSRTRVPRSFQKFASLARGVIGGEIALVGVSGGRLLVWGAGTSPAARFFQGASRMPRSGLMVLEGNLYNVITAPVRRHGRQVGSLAVARRFDLAELGVPGPLALWHAGRLVRSTFPVSAQAPGLAPDCVRSGCQLRMNGESFLVIPMGRAGMGEGLSPDDRILSFQSIDAAVSQVIGGFGAWLPVTGSAIGLLVLVLAASVSRGLSRPLHELVARLETSQASGRWDIDFPEESATREVNLLAAAINRAANAVAHSNEQLDQASLDFVETMAQALDARDPCTAGHSQRVSEYATAIAINMGLAPDEIETIRIGARLHDIGKIGISDTLLRKPGNLTPEEYDRVKQHPQIGRRILERVAAFEQYLPFVELHHEDFDGQGYPHGLKGHEVPLAVRIVRVADVFDALTTDRSYRRAIPLDFACELIDERAGTKFDPDVVLALRATLGNASSSELIPLESLA